MQAISHKIEKFITVSNGLELFKQEGPVNQLKLQCAEEEGVGLNFSDGLNEIALELDTMVKNLENLNECLKVGKIYLATVWAEFKDIKID